MKIEEFNYEKKDGEKSHRRVMVLNSNKEYVDALDLDKLEAEEIKELFKLQAEYENKIEPFVKKAFRRFSKSGITDLLVEKNEK